jgi:peptidoglycan glycosyltransferase
VNRQISAVALATLVLLSTLIVATTYWQTWATGGLEARQDNAIQRVAQFEIKRGWIYAADGRTVLARNVRKKVGAQTLYFRTYPTKGFASQVVGYSTQTRARAGIEQSENQYLTASNKDLGTFLDTLGDRLKGSTITGNDLVLTLMVKPQRIAESMLRGKCGAAVLIAPKTGAVLVMASSPSYDPNLIEKPGGFGKILNSNEACKGGASPLLNRATQGLYPPGSTFKTVTAAAALESGKFKRDSRFDDPGYCVQYGKKVYNAGNPDQNGPEAFGNVDLVTAFEHSINAVFCQIGQKLGAGKVLDQAKRFGFYSLPPLDTPADARAASGLYDSKRHRLFDPKDPNDVDPGRLGFGQERLLVTPLQMAMVAAGIANGGVVMEPQLIKAVRNPGGKAITRLKPHKYATATKLQTANDIRDMMVKAVQSGTGRAAQISGVAVAGKTGTAETGQNHVYHAWFIFFAPAEDPVVAGAVVVESQLNGFGGSVAAPIAKALMEAVLPAASKETSG